MSDTAMHVSWLNDMVEAMVRYGSASGRLAMHDLALMETLRDFEGQGRLNCTAMEAMVRLVDRDERVFIAGPKGADVWTFFDEDAAEVIERVGLANVDFDPEADES